MLARFVSYCRRHHLALLSLFVALGGTSYAAATLPKNSVGAKQLKKGAVTPSKVAPRTVRLFKGQKGGRGPQGIQGAAGPGATHLTYQSGPTGGTSTPFTTVGKIGGWTLLARCITNGTGQLELDLDQYGEGATADIEFTDHDPSATPSSSNQIVSGSVPALPASTPGVFDQVPASSGKTHGHAFDYTVAFTGGSIVQAHLTDFVSNLASPVTPFCRFSSVAFPVG